MQIYKKHPTYLHFRPPFNIFCLKTCHPEPPAVIPSPPAVIPSAVEGSHVCINAVFLRFSRGRFSQICEGANLRPRLG